MRSARVICVCSLTAELFTIADGPDKRLAQEAEALAKQSALAKALATPGPAGSLLTSEALREDEEPSGRPTITIIDFVPKEWSVTYNTFRKADELEITIPLALLPVPLSAIRGARIQAVVRHIEDDDFSAGILPSSNVDFPDFFGTLKRGDGTLGADEIGTIKLPFLDLVGILSTTKVPAGKTLDESLSISQSITQFLVGTWGEGLPVRWVDPRDPEPSLGKYRPALFKAQKGKKSQREVPSQYSYLDAITLACNDIGCVARVIGAEIQIAFAGTMYQGLDRSSDIKTTLLVGQAIEEIGWGHEFLGQKLQSVQVISFDPITHRQYTARFPVDAKNKAPQTVQPNARAAVPPIVASLGQPGSQALEDSIVQIPLGPVSNPELLPQVAEAIFHERARQRTTFTIKTHSPWSNPADMTSPADLLTLRAGDNIAFGYVDSDLIPGSAKALAGQLSQGETQFLLQQNGVPKKQAAQIAAAVALVPPVDKLRVDEVKISGGVDTDAMIELKLVTFTTIISDLQASADGRPFEAIEKAFAAAVDAADAGISALRELLKRAREQVQNSGLSADAQAAALKQIDEREAALLRDA